MHGILSIAAKSFLNKDRFLCPALVPTTPPRHGLGKLGFLSCCCLFTTSLLVWRKRFEFFNLFDEISFLVIELFIFRTICVKPSKEFY